DDGDPVERLRRAGLELVKWRDFRAPWRREPFAREAALDDMIERVHAFRELQRSCSAADTFYADTWLARRISDDVRVNESVTRRDHDALEAVLTDLARDWKFRRPRSGSERNYRGSVTRDQVRDAHARLVASLEELAKQADADLVAQLQGALFE